jgi:hypothetical protein
LKQRPTQGCRADDYDDDDDDDEGSYRHQNGGIQLE